MSADQTQRSFVFSWTTKTPGRATAVRVELPRLDAIELRWLRSLLRATKGSARDWEAM